MLCQFPRAVMAKCHKPGGLKQHKRILFQFWRLELWYQGGSRAMLFWNLERNPPLPLPSCMCLVGSFGIHCLQLYHSNLYLHCCFFLIYLFSLEADYNIAVVFAIQSHESAMVGHVFPIPIISAFIVTSVFAGHLCVFTCFLVLTCFMVLMGLPWWLSDKESACQCRGREFDPWVGKIPWRKKWQPIPIFLPGVHHGQRSVVGYSPWVTKSWTWLSN